MRWARLDGRTARPTSTAAAIAVALLAAAPARAQLSDGIFDGRPFGSGTRQPDETYEESRSIIGDNGEPDTLAFRVSLYGSPAADMPLLVQVHEWGGSFEREEEIVAYEAESYEFVMLYFQYVPSTGNEDDWWFGTHWDGECRMWAHEAVIDIVNEVVQTSLVPDSLAGVTIDPDRVYLFGHSIGGTGAWQLGMRHPEVFAAFHAHAGFARFTPPVGPFQEQFENDIVGGASDGIIIRDPEDGSTHPARDFSSVAWWLENQRDPAWDSTFVTFTHGTGDDTVPAASGGDLMQPILEAQRRGYHYHRHSMGHSEDVFARLGWMWRLRRDQSYLALTNSTNDDGAGNDMSVLSWDPSSIVDEPERYQVRLVGSGTADVTPRRLQQFQLEPGGDYRYWIGDLSGPGEPIPADDFGLITVPGVPGEEVLLIQPEGAEPPDGDADVDADSDVDGDGDMDADTDGDTDVDGDADGGSDADGDGDGCGCSTTTSPAGRLAGLVLLALALFGLARPRP